jgi:hypothetical protein
MGADGAQPATGWLRSKAGRTRDRQLLLPGTLLVPVLAELLPPLVLVDFGFPALFQ